MLQLCADRSWKEDTVLKRLPILEDLPWGTGDHPDGSKPLSAFKAVTAICNDCGHTKTLEEQDLRALSAVPTLADLAKRVYCIACREEGSTGKANLEFRTDEIDVPHTRKVEWSTKAVFTEDRADPTPNLPRRSIFDRRNLEMERIR